MNNENNHIKDKNLNSKEKILFKDLIAIIIAVFEIFVPIIIGAAVIFTFIMLFVTKIWLKV